jgi:hypothetical protein
LANTKLLTQQSPKFHEHLTHVFWRKLDPHIPLAVT